MVTEGLTTLVVGYDEVEAALTDFRDLAAVRHAHGVGDYEAAVVRSGESRHEVVATTVDARLRGTLFGAGLGLIVAAVISPVLATAAVGAGLGAIFGNVSDQIDAFKHADMREVEQLVDGSTANMIIIANDATTEDISKAACSRGRRIVVPFSGADVDVLERELQRITSFGGPQAAGT
jgi:uncharacterized membrane protein